MARRMVMRMVMVFCVVLALVTGCTATVVRGRARVVRLPTGTTADPWSTAAGTDTLVTDPTASLSASQLTFLRQVADRTWRFLSGPDQSPATHLLRDSVQSAAPMAAQEYTNPALIGNWLAAIAAAKDLGVAPADQAQSTAAAVLAQLRRLGTYQGFFFRWYNSETGVATVSPQGAPITGGEGYVSTVDNGWLAQGMLTAARAFPALAAGFDALLGAMRWQLLYDKADNVLYNGYQVGGGYSTSTYQNAYSGPRIANYMAIGSGQVPGALWWGPARTPPAGRRQRQTPQGAAQTYTDPQNHRPYTLFEGHYTYDRIKFVPTFDGSIYQALAPNLVVPEQTLAPGSLGLNDRNTALAQGAYGALGARTPAWGWAPATSPTGRYTNYGVPDLGSQTGTVPHDMAVPYAAFLALPVLPTQAYTDIQQLITSYPGIYTQYGFLDSAAITGGAVATRFMAISQTAILMAIDDAVDHDQLQTYVGGSSYAQALAPYLAMERYSIEGLAS